MTIADRPASLRRSAPRPSPVENIDPIDTTPVPSLAPATTPAPAPVAATAEAPAPASTATKTPKRGSGGKKQQPAAETAAATATPVFKRARGPREREIVVQLNSKISLKARDTLDQITAYDGRTIRSGIETGIFLLDYLIKKEQTGEMPVLEEMLEIYGADD